MNKKNINRLSFDNIIFKVIIKKILINICDNQNSLIFIITTESFISVEIIKKT
jgi:hypothetical protein